MKHHELVLTGLSFLPRTALPLLAEPDVSTKWQRIRRTYLEATIASSSEESRTRTDYSTVNFENPVLAANGQVRVLRGVVYAAKA